MTARPASIVTAVSPAALERSRREVDRLYGESLPAATREELARQRALAEGWDR
jgi:hypothetical protein